MGFGNSVPKINFANMHACLIHIKIKLRTANDDGIEKALSYQANQDTDLSFFVKIGKKSKNKTERLTVLYFFMDVFTCT